MATFGLAAMNRAGIGPNAGVGDVLEYFDGYYDDNFLPVTQQLGDTLSDSNFVRDRAAQAGDMGRRAGLAGNAIINRDISRYGVALDPRQEQLLNSTQNRNSVLSEVDAGNRAMIGLDSGFLNAQKAFANQGIGLAGQVMSNDVALQNFQMQRDVAAEQAAMKQLLQQYVNDTTLEQAQADARYAIDEGRDARNDTIIGDLAGRLHDGATI